MGNLERKHGITQEPTQFTDVGHLPTSTREHSVDVFNGRTDMLTLGIVEIVQAEEIFTEREQVFSQPVVSFLHCHLFSVFTVTCLERIIVGESLCDFFNATTASAVGQDGNFGRRRPDVGPRHTAVIVDS